MLGSFGCTSVGRLVVAPTPTATPTALATLRATNTVTPTPTITPTPTWTPTSIPTVTPTPTITPTPTATPSPIPVASARVIAADAIVRSGPGLVFPKVGVVQQGQEFGVTGANGSGTWWQICCLEADKKGWVRVDLVEITGPLNEVAVITVPTPTPRPTATATPIPPTPTPGLLFYRARGPEFRPTNNELATIWVKVYGGAGDGYPIPGWRLEIKRDGQVVGVSEPSRDFFEKNAPADFDYGDPYNLKYEILHPGTASWEFYLIDSNGVRRSPIVEFTTQPSNPNREVWVAFLSTR